MVIQENSFIRDQNVAIPQTADTGWIALTETHRNEYTFSTCSLSKPLHFLSIYENQVCNYLTKERMILNRSPQSRPNRETGKKRFRKRNKLGTVPCCFTNEITRLVKSRFTVEINRSSVNRSGFKAGKTLLGGGIY